jgi:membrane protein required for beta-lactamase induction
VTLQVTEPDPTTNAHDVGISIASWEEACSESQAWANKMRRKAEFRRLRHRAYWLMLFMVLVLFVTLFIIVRTGS